MAMVCRRPQLLVINGALNDGEMAPDMTCFSVSMLHSEWIASLLPTSRSLLGKVRLSGTLAFTHI